MKLTWLASPFAAPLIGPQGRWGGLVASPRGRTGAGCSSLSLGARGSKGGLGEEELESQLREAREKKLQEWTDMHQSGKLAEVAKMLEEHYEEELDSDELAALQVKKVPPPHHA
jgi:hypothetical protein